MSDIDQPLRELLDRDSIERLLIRYCNANDADDWDGMASVYVEDGRSERAKRFSGIREIATTMMPIDHIDREQHILSNVEITIDGDTASAFSAARVYVVGTRGPTDIMLTRGITYTDRLVRTHEGWKIEDRKHHLVWMTESTPIEGQQVQDRK